MSSNSDNLGIGGCDTLSKTETVTGVETEELRFVVYACTVGEVTVTAEVRLTDATSPEASVSQQLMVEALPEIVIGPTGREDSDNDDDAGDAAGGAEGGHPRDRAV